MSQMRRAGVSVPANIAEGCGRQGGADFGRFLQIAMGSASELEYHVILAEELGFLKKEDSASLNNRVIEVKRMITMLMQKVKVTSRQQQGCQQSIENLITED
jgi:four helix bundle protein